MFKRKPTYPVHEIFTNRWSPRAMSGESISDEELLTLFEAARWAPSSYNAQQWRFVYVHRDTPHWQNFFDLLVPFNQGWADKAAVLVVIVSRKTFEHNDKPSRTHSFDAGSAWMSLALQGSIDGLVVHGMEGFDYDAARSALSIPDDFVVEAMCAIGRPGNVKELSPELQEREQPSDRKPLKEIIFEGKIS